jgi:hypothetical protein
VIVIVIAAAAVAVAAPLLLFSCTIHNQKSVWFVCMGGRCFLHFVGIVTCSGFLTTSRHQM